MNNKIDLMIIIRLINWEIEILRYWEIEILRNWEIIKKIMNDDDNNNYYYSVWKIKLNLKTSILSKSCWIS